MDPNLFHLDWERTFEVLAAIVVLSFILERALAVPFESRLWVGSAMDRSVGKEIIAVIAGAAMCLYLKFDALSMIILTSKTTYYGEVMTGAVIAGGSKASIKLFQDIFNVQSSAVRQKKVAQATATAATAANTLARELHR